MSGRSKRIRLTLDCARPDGSGYQITSEHASTKLAEAHIRILQMQGIKMLFKKIEAIT